MATPIAPRGWTQPTSITASFGHGFATTPLQTAVGIGAILNNGIFHRPTFLKKQGVAAEGRRIVSRNTSEKMRYLYRLNAIKGSGRRANIAGFRVGGKTGTAEKVINGKYAKHHNFNAFAAAFPMEKPKYVLLVIVDDPKAQRPGMVITAASNATPVAAEIIKRTAFILGIIPDFTQAASIPITSAD
ncbi:penicillin-binding transpeptidase domain-containing protein [Ochrobactrum sp. RH2CCR150]|uniref:penicillin-binding transpeptidase domain-containing protein n=1 Tax=Ochrobactrum sp. RH2CCR150 TaxID=2587044 RepID=UPI0015FD4982|nr:cell division protein FtsI/penicillin-binding protein 2 [Ochrobactrum sp. RH2CCR150]